MKVLKIGQYKNCNHIYPKTIFRVQFLHYHHKNQTKWKKKVLFISFIKICFITFLIHLIRVTKMIKFSSFKTLKESLWLSMVSKSLSCLNAKTLTLLIAMWSIIKLTSQNYIILKFSNSLTKKCKIKNNQWNYPHNFLILMRNQDLSKTNCSILFILHMIKSHLNKTEKNQLLH